MALNFPTSPTLNQTYSVGTKTWKWNGYAWDLNIITNPSFESLTVTGNTITQHIIPSANVTYDLGSNANRFRDLYLSGNTINLGDATVSANGTAIDLPAGTKVGGRIITFDSLSTLTTDTAFSSSDSGFTTYKTTRYKDVPISTYADEPISSLENILFRSASSVTEEEFYTTVICDNENDIIVTLPSANSVSVGFYITLNALNLGGITVENAPETNDIIRYPGWKFETLKITYASDSLLSEYEDTNFYNAANLYEYPLNEIDSKYTFKFTCISNSSYMLTTS